MTTTDLAAIMLFLMPVTVTIRTIIYAVLTFALLRQRNSTRLDWAILVLFAAITLSGVVSVVQRWYLYTRTDPASLTETSAWMIVVSTVVFPTIESGVGILVLFWNREFDREPERKDQRDKRQDAQQLVLDETSLVNTSRGKILSEAGVMLDERRVMMNTEQDAMDVRRVGMDAEQHGMDDQQSNLDEREGRQP